ncbi:hypothetical protein CF68_22530 [Cupriavidus sp. SK-4]|nr:hypothetical protein CF68_22530 [Cupriavidus sp. SK-4]
MGPAPDSAARGAALEMDGFKKATLGEADSLYKSCAKFRTGGNTLDPSEIRATKAICGLRREDFIFGAIAILKASRAASPATLSKP